MESLRRIALTVVVILLVEVAALAVVVGLGAYDVAAASSHTPIGRWLLAVLKVRSIEVRAIDIVAPALDDPSLVIPGAHRYLEMCETCHGGPGISRSEIGRGLTPRPPDLERAARRWNNPELFWIVKNGIKLAGMPAFGESHSDREVWSIVAFVRELPNLSADDYAAIAAADARRHDQR